MAGRRATLQAVMRKPLVGLGRRVRDDRLDVSDGSDSTDRIDAAFTDFYESTAAPVFGLVKVMLGERPVAETVAAQVYGEVWQAADENNAPSEEMLIRLLMTAHRRASEYLRGQENSQLPDASIPLMTTPACVRRLELAARRLVELVYYRGYTCDQAAKTLGLSPQAAYSGLRAALFEMSKSSSDGQNPEPGPESKI